ATGFNAANKLNDFRVGLTKHFRSRTDSRKERNKRVILRSNAAAERSIQGLKVIDGPIGTKWTCEKRRIGCDNDLRRRDDLESAIQQKPPDHHGQRANNHRKDPNAFCAHVADRHPEQVLRCLSARTPFRLTSKCCRFTPSLARLLIIDRGRFKDVRSQILHLPLCVLRVSVTLWQTSHSPPTWIPHASPSRPPRPLRGPSCSSCLRVSVPLPSPHRSRTVTNCAA